MKTNRKGCTAKRKYLLPEVEFAVVIVEQGFADSVEVVGKDGEVSLY